MLAQASTRWPEEYAQQQIHKRQVADHIRSDRLVGDLDPGESESGDQIGHAINLFPVAFHPFTLIGVFLEVA